MRTRTYTELLCNLAAAYTRAFLDWRKDTSFREYYQGRRHSLFGVLSYELRYTASPQQRARVGQEIRSKLLLNRRGQL